MKFIVAALSTAAFLIPPCFAADDGAEVNLDQQLSEAIEKNQRDLIKALVARGANIADRIPLQDWPTPGTTEFLLGLGARASATNARGETALNVLGSMRKNASISRVLQIAKVLVDHGADVNAANKDGNTPLLRAVGAGSIEMVKFLVAHGGDVNATNKAGETPLVLAIRSGNSVIAEFLLNHGATINPVDVPISRTPLGMAVESRQPVFVGMMLKYGANANGTGKADITPLGKAAASTDTHDIALLLLEHGANVNAANESGETPLHWAARSGSVEIVRRLIEAGANKEAKDRSSRTPFQWASGDRMRRLLNRMSPLDQTALKRACGTVVSLTNRGALTTIIQPRSGDEETPDLIEPQLPEGDDVSAGDWSRVTISGKPYWLGRAGGWPVVLANNSIGGLYDPICFFARRGKSIYIPREIDRVISSAKAMDVDPYDLAITRQEGTDALEALLNASGEKKYAFLGDKDYLSAALYLAVYRNRADAASILLEHGADPNAVPYVNGLLGDPPPPLSAFMDRLRLQADGIREHSVLYYAVRHSDFEMVRLLLEHGADPNFSSPGPRYHPTSQADLWSRSPLARLVSLLLKHGGNPTSLTSSSLKYLLDKNDNATIKRLVAYGSASEWFGLEAGLVDDNEAVDTLRGGDRALHEASCRAMHEPLTDECLPSALVAADSDLDIRYKALMTASDGAANTRLRNQQKTWIKQRNHQCGLTLEPSRRGGWYSYVLTDNARARCVIAMTRQRIADLSSKRIHESLETD